MLFKVLTHDCPMVAHDNSKDEAAYNGGGTADDGVTQQPVSQF